MTKLDELVRHCETEVSKAQSPVLLWSGGKDSTFLLFLLRKLKLPVGVLTLHHLWTKDQMKFVVDTVQKLDLTVFHYAPMQIGFTSPHAILDYWIGHTTVKRIMDHVPTSDRCGLDEGRKATRESRMQPGYMWDLTVTGTKATDQHELVDRFLFSDVHGHRFMNPLWDWTDDEVLKTAKELGFQLDLREGEFVDTGNFIGCMACLESEKAVYCPKVGKMIEGLKYGAQAS